MGIWEHFWYFLLFLTLGVASAVLGEFLWRESVRLSCDYTLQAKLEGTTLLAGGSIFFSLVMVVFFLSALVSIFL